MGWEFRVIRSYDHKLRKYLSLKLDFEHLKIYWTYCLMWTKCTIKHIFKNFGSLTKLLQKLYTSLKFLLKNILSLWSWGQMYYYTHIYDSSLALMTQNYTPRGYFRTEMYTHGGYWYTQIPTLRLLTEYVACSSSSCLDFRSDRMFSNSKLALLTNCKGRQGRH